MMSLVERLKRRMWSEGAPDGEVLSWAVRAHALASGRGWVCVAALATLLVSGRPLHAQGRTAPSGPLASAGQTRAPPASRGALSSRNSRTADALESRIVNVARVSYRDAARGEYPEVRDSVIVRTDTGAVRPAAVTFTKTVATTDATLGDTVLFTIEFANAGPGGARRVVIEDTLPAAFRWLAPIIDRPLAVQWAADTVPSGRVRWRFTAERVGAGASIRIRLPGVVAATPSAPVENLADATFLTVDAAGREIAPRLRASATVVLTRAQLALTKTLVGRYPQGVRVGDTLTYEIGYRNLSATVPARQVLLLDRVPRAARVVEVSAGGVAADAPNVIQWDLGTLAPGASGLVRLRMVIVRVPEGGELINRATLSATTLQAVAVQSTPVLVVPDSDPRARLVLEKRASALEVRLGESVEFVLRIENVGRAPAFEVVVDDDLPAGLALVPTSVQGATVRVEAGRLRLAVAAPLAPGAVATVRYLVTATAEPTQGRQYVNRALVVARDRASGLRVMSLEAQAAVRRRLGFALASRLVLGTVFVDRNGDGRQSLGEPGVAGARVWSLDGQVVRTDSLGRFHLPDVVPGMVVVRLDPASLPAHLAVPSPAAQQRVVRVDGWTTPAVRFPVRPRLESRALAVTASERGPSEPREGNGREEVREVAPVAPLRGAAAAEAARVAGVTRESEVAGARPTVPALTAAGWWEQRDAQRVLFGPPVRLRQPQDGAVLGRKHVYVEVFGDPGAVVTLYRANERIAEAVVRPDRVAEFLAVTLPEGPQRLRVRSRGRWVGPTGPVQWDSIAVHRSGPAVRIRRLERGLVRLRVDAVPAVLTLAVEDRWGVRVVQAPMLDVQRVGARVLGMDADARSVGDQRQVDEDGVLRLHLAADTAGTGWVRVRTLEAAARGATDGRDGIEVPLRIAPSAERFRAIGTATVGVGAATGDYGAVLASGQIGGGRTVEVSVDSRRQRNARDGRAGGFQRVFDPMDEVRLPAIGDGSTRRVLAGMGAAVSARLEQGESFVAVGDVTASAFRVGSPLVRAPRALPGVRTNVTRGAWTLHGYGSQTTQLLVQQQWRGNGTSGPISLGGGMRAGTEAVYLETRALENAARILVATPLVRFVDYDVDYLAGVVLLRRMVPAADAAGNPLFVRVRAERLSGGASQWVGGWRAAVDLAALGREAPVGDDRAARVVVGVSHTSEPVAASVVAPTSLATRRATVGADVVATRTTSLGQWAAAIDVAEARTTGGVTVAGTAPSRAGTPLATAGSLQWRGVQRGSVALHWVHIDSGFDASLDPRLAVGQAERRVRAELPLAAGTQVVVAHEDQRYPQLLRRRRQTTVERQHLVAGQRVIERVQWLTDVMEAGAPRQLLGRDSVGGFATRTTTLVSRTQWTPHRAMDVWAEVSRSGWFQGADSLRPSRPDGEALGLTWRTPFGLSADVTQRWARWKAYDTVPTRDMAVTSIRVRSHRVYGAQVRSGVEWQSDLLGDNVRTRQAAVLGYDQRVALGGGWSVTGTVERRLGLERLSLLDPTRALPFAQLEPNRTRQGVSVQWTPATTGARLLLRGDRSNATDLQNRHIESRADWPIREQVALLLRVRRVEQRRRAAGATSPWVTRADQRGIVGVAMRPTQWEAVHMLAKLETRRTATPGMGLGTVVGGARDERRVIGVLDVVLRPPRWAWLEVDARAATRWAQWRALRAADTGAGAIDGFALVPPARTFLGLTATAGQPAPLWGEGAASRHWAGRVRGRLAPRLDVRQLVVAGTAANPIALAGSLVRHLDARTQLEVGYRGGALRDRDFARFGRTGWFAAVSVVFSDATAPSALAFWRERVAHQP